MQKEINHEIDPEVKSEKLYDLCFIENFCRGNQEQVKKMVRVFIEQMPHSVDEIKSAYQKGDFDLIKKVAHRIKPVLSYYAIVKVDKVIRQIEFMAAEGTASYELSLKIEKLDEVILQIVEQMKNTLSHY